LVSFVSSVLIQRRYTESKNRSKTRNHDEWVDGLTAEHAALFSVASGFSRTWIARTVIAAMRDCGAFLSSVVSGFSRTWIDGTFSLWERGCRRFARGQERDARHAQCCDDIKRYSGRRVIRA